MPARAKPSTGRYLPVTLCSCGEWLHFHDKLSMGFLALLQTGSPEELKKQPCVKQDEKEKRFEHCQHACDTVTGWGEATHGHQTTDVGTQWLLGLSLCFFGGDSAVSPGGELLISGLSSLVASHNFSTMLLPPFLPSRLSFCLFHPLCTIRICTSTLSLVGAVI